MLTQVTELASLSAVIRELLKRLKHAPIVGYNRFLDYTLIMYSYEQSYHLLITDGSSSFVGHMQLIPRSIDIGTGPRIVAYETHVYLAKDYRGLGIAYKLYEWASKRWTLIPSNKHSQGANNIWKKLTANLPVMFLKQRSKVHHRYEIMGSFNRRQFKDAPSFRVMIGTFVNLDD